MPSDYRDLPRLVIVVDRYPCVSETFIQREVSALEEYGLPILIVSLRPKQRCDMWIHPSMQRLVVYPQGGAWHRMALFLVQFVQRPRLTLQLLRCARDCVPGPRGMWRATQTVALTLQLLRHVAEMRIGQIHAHFLHRPALVACLMATARSCTCSLSAHGRDIHVPEYDLDALCRHADFVSVCSQHGREQLLKQLAPDNQAKLICCHHGLESVWLRRSITRPASDGAPVVVSVGRLVEKKGLDTVLRAVALLQSDGCDVHYRIVGGGPDASCLRHTARRLQLRHVEFLGAVAPDRIPAILQQSDVFVLGCRVARDGDRDGIPNAMLEAMALGVPVVATNAGGVGEIIRDGRNGCLVPVDDPPALADTLHRLLADGALRRQLGQRARETVAEHFDVSQNIRPLLRRFEAALRPPP